MAEYVVLHVLGARVLAYTLIEVQISMRALPSNFVLPKT